MAYAIGVLLSAAVLLFARVVGFHRDRAFYPTILMIVASFYILFATIGASGRSLLFEILVALGFTTLAVLGYKRSFRIIAAGIFAHGVFDFFHHFFVPNPGMPPWWPAFCMSFDVAMGAWLLLRPPRAVGS